jgi:transcriptional regulator with XRE-family HTH domain
MPKTIFTGANAVVVEALRQARLDSGLTQADLAARIGRDQSHISLIEGSQRRLDLVEFIELARALGAEPLELFAKMLSAVDAAKA